jgi:hypothetical protein
VEGEHAGSTLGSRYLQAPISLIDKVIKEKEAEAEQARIAP